ncbi:MAG: PadR family transcriptional regulator [Firmicutes bacterium]|nr:PadR family transcriptional regulator [Bacillota bacterium]
MSEFAKLSSNFIRGNVEPMILMCLLQGELYGLEILEKIKDSSGGTYVLKQPTLYSALKRLEDKKFIRGYYVEIPNGPRRKYFNLTDLGKKSLTNNKEDWRSSKDILDHFFFSQIGKFKNFGADNMDLINELTRMREELEEANQKRNEATEALSNVEARQQELIQTRSAEILEQFIEEKANDEKPGEVDGKLLEQVQSLESQIAAIQEQLEQQSQQDVIEEKPEQIIQEQFLQVEQIEEKVESIAQEKIEEEEQQITSTDGPTQVGFFGDSKNPKAKDANAPQYITQYFISGDYYLGGGNSSTNVVKNQSDDAFSLPLSSGEEVAEQMQEPKQGVVKEEENIPEQPQEQLSPYFLSETKETIVSSENITFKEQTVTTIDVIDQISSEEEIRYLQQQISANKNHPLFCDCVTHDENMKRYIGPNEYATMGMSKQEEKQTFTQAILPQDEIQEPKVNYYETDEVQIAPFSKHFSRIRSRDFILYNRLKASVSMLVAAVLILGVLVTWISVRSVYQQNEEVMFTLAYVGIAIYVLINLAIWAIYPRMRRINGHYKNELIIRSCITTSILAIILGVNIIMGLSNVSTNEHIVFFIVPSILALGVVLEWVGIALLKGINVYRG